MNINNRLVSEKFILGCWRLNQCPFSEKELIDFLYKINELGINSFDHADIYGDYECEKIFGRALKVTRSLRDKIKITSKCGIKFPSEKFPSYRSHIYDTSYMHIINSVDRSLDNLNTDHLDLLLIHRPDPLMNAEEISQAFYRLKKEGKVLTFGVSNFSQIQFEVLQSFLDFNLVTNQIEASVLCHDNFDNGNFDYLQFKRIIPQIWSPLAGGRVLKPVSKSEKAVYNKLNEIANLYCVQPYNIALAWLLLLPVKPMIILGTWNYERIEHSIKSVNIKLNRDEWFSLWTSYRGCDIP